MTQGFVILKVSSNSLGTVLLPKSTNMELNLTATHIKVLQLVFLLKPGLPECLIKQARQK